MAALVDIFWRLVSLVVTPQCSEQFFIEMNFLHVECLKSTLSKGLGLGIVAGASLVKLPQVWKIASSGSAEGLSLFGTMMELLAVLGSTAYCFVNNFPFSAYGEGVFLILQTSVVVALILYLSGYPVTSLLFGLTMPVLALLLISPLTPPLLLWSIQTGCVPIIVTGKLVQAGCNYRAGGTGQLSLLTVALLFLGSMARVFTSLHETGDVALIATHASGTAANGLLLGQLIYYGYFVCPASSSSSAAAAAGGKRKAKQIKTD